MNNFLYIFLPDAIFSFDENFDNRQLLRKFMINVNRIIFISIVDFLRNFFFSDVIFTFDENVDRTQSLSKFMANIYRLFCDHTLDFSLPHRGSFVLTKTLFFSRF